MKIISKSFQEIEIPFSSEDNNSIFLNATVTAKKFNKDVREWRRAKQTSQYIDALIDVGNFHIDDLIIVRKGGQADNQGTWIHKKLIIAFARWLSPEFAVWCDSVIEEILKTGSYSQTPNLEKIKTRTELLEHSGNQYEIFEKVFFKIGITQPEELAITSNRAVKKETGVDFIELAKRKGVEAPQKFYTVTELCQIVRGGDFSEDIKKSVSTKNSSKPRPQNLNTILEYNGFQVRENGEWRATDKGNQFSKLIQNKAIASDKTVYHLAWRVDILEKIF
jgi:frataxin-like iron-binding protein CyaY